MNFYVILLIGLIVFENFGHFIANVRTDDIKWHKFQKRLANTCKNIKVMEKHIKNVKNVTCDFFKGFSNK